MSTGWKSIFVNKKQSKRKIKYNKLKMEEGKRKKLKKETESLSTKSWE